jgi:hypothetical protein
LAVSAKNFTGIPLGTASVARPLPAWRAGVQGEARRLTHR